MKQSRPLARASALALAIASVIACGGEPRREGCQQPGEFGALGTLCGFAKPEDVEAIESSGVVLVSEQGWSAPVGGGSISAVVIPAIGADVAPAIRLWPRGEPTAPARPPRAVYGEPTCTPPDPEAFSPHGLTSRPLGAGRQLVAVVRHGEREAVELFELSGVGASVALRWAGCIPLPDDTAGNDAAFAASEELVVTNYVPTLSGLRTIYHHLRAFLGKDSGDVLAWSESNGWRHIADSAAPMPNGVAVAADGFVYVAAAGGRNVYRVRLDGSGQREIVARFAGGPDNLAWSPSGALLVAVLRADPQGRGLCRRAPLPGCPAPWSLVEVDPHTGNTRELLRHDGSAVHSVTSAARAGPWMFFGSMAEDRIGIALAPAGE
jgi:hypothetical protein